jgi:molybdopterin molybdotransferase
VSPPEVAVLTTGDEVVEPEFEPGPGQLRDSNSAFLLAAGADLGLRFERLGIASDDLADLREKISRGLEADVLLLTGGVSMGDFDLVEDVLVEKGCETLVDAVSIQPGKPLVVAHHDRGWAFGLPGNPASVMVTFYLFVRPLLRRLLGFDDAFWHGAVTAELLAPLPGARSRDRFLPASIAFDRRRLLATPHPPTGSHDVVAYARGTALVRIRQGAAPAAAGDACEVLPLVSWLEPGGQSGHGVASE